MTSSSRVLITGSTGFVGQWLTKTKPPDTIIYGINRAKYEAGDWKYQTWDYIIHLAPTPPTDVLACGARVLYASSGIVYHPENTARAKYREDKLAGEAECVRSGAVIARLFTFYGKGLDDNKAITAFQKAGQEHRPLVITGDGSTVRSYMHGREMGEILWVVLRKGQPGEAYDIGDDRPVTMLQLANMYACGSEIIIQGGTDPMPFYLPNDLDKTRKLLENKKYDTIASI